MDKYRFNLELSLQAKQLLEGLEKRTGAPSLTHVLRRALGVYDALHTYASKDWEVILQNKKTGEKRTLELV